MTTTKAKAKTRTTGRNIRHILLLFAFAAAALAACDSGKVYDRFLHTPTNGWEKNEGVAFDIPAVSHDGTYRMNLQLRTDNSFPFQSVTLVVEQTLAPRDTTLADTILCRLASDNGKILGDGINIYQYSFHLNTRHYAAGDSTHVSVRHIMKREMLPGVTEVGIRLQRVEH